MNESESSMLLELLEHENFDLLANKRSSATEIHNRAASKSYVWWCGRCLSRLPKFPKPRIPHKNPTNFHNITPSRQVSSNISFVNIVASNITPQNTSAQIPNQNTPTPFPSPNNNTEIYQLLFILKEFAQLFSSDGIQTMFNNLQAATTKEDKLFVILHGFSSFLNKSN
ncbi:hypothetical protein CEXT_352991 [Caerostris extrusa]|uniref:Uncharacterized protein n=1 Tax=Caerostris extrusa TaxID=172846 RepID=A0AAV4WFN6_CAEEX|nr:hypothetical protein CEXT_352991 [Caerostris extrusa]